MVIVGLSFLAFRTIPVLSMRPSLGQGSMEHDSERIIEFYSDQLDNTHLAKYFE